MTCYSLVACATVSLEFIFTDKALHLVLPFTVVQEPQDWFFFLTESVVSNVSCKHLLCFQPYIQYYDVSNIFMFFSHVKILCLRASGRLCLTGQVFMFVLGNVFYILKLKVMPLNSSTTQNILWAKLNIAKPLKNNSGDHQQITMLFR